MVNVPKLLGRAGVPIVVLRTKVRPGGMALPSVSSSRGSIRLEVQCCEPAVAVRAHL